MTLKELKTVCYCRAKEKGWGDPPVIEQIALLHSEVSEALEAFRNNEPRSWTDSTGKPQGLASEYADILIRIGHYAEVLGIDLEYEVARKLRYNATRPYRHGDKAV